MIDTAPTTPRRSVLKEASMTLRKLSAGIAIAMLAWVSATTLAGPAGSLQGIGTVEGTGGDGLNVRQSPDTTAGVVVNLPEGTSVVIDCYAYGETVDGYWYTSDLWQRISSPVVGYVTDTYLYTGYDGPVPGTRGCDEAPALDPGPQHPYDRQAAAGWALAHAQDLRYDSVVAASCTWFVSQAMWAGGLPQDSVWNGRDTHGLRRLPGSVTAWLADDAIAHVRGTFNTMSFTLDFRANRVVEAEVGDIIAYDYESNGVIDHLAMVVSIAEGAYPEVAEWGVGDLSTFGQTPYQTRGWTWSAISGTWLQRKHPNISAQLIHFVDG